MQDLSYLIIKASKNLKNKLDKALKEFDITLVQFSVIIQIYLSDQPITAAEIAQKLGSDRPTISGIINRLEKKGIVLKIDNLEDKRSSYLEIYKESYKLVEKIKIISDELTINIFSIYSKEEIKQFTGMISKLIEGTRE
ncbi:MarR family winged helix-turn-helix transcriptional regulator [Clostridium sp.]|uniref:MarR family winged helix-turn-helix transcriptional regulator n=1 Tax=Clostridium sp. TaxID=1506 RepID=UPI002620427C|nr:MarR family transcriptional regulator [uncultured Clostridium sp.]